MFLEKGKKEEVETHALHNDTSIFKSNYGAYRVFFRIANFDPENVVQQPVDGLLLVEHEDELDDKVEVWSLEHFSCRKVRIFLEFQQLIFGNAMTKPLIWTKTKQGKRGKVAAGLKKEKENLISHCNEFSHLDVLFSARS